MLERPEIKAKRLSGELWYEIDDIQDLDIASSMFADDNEQKVALIQERFGGYWRYPKMIDFCYLVNPYFPPQRLMDEMKNNFETLITEYPSGMKVNSLLAAKNFGVKQEHIVVGNGAAELIKSLMHNLFGKTGFIRPTFEEYPNRYSEANSVYFMVNNDSLQYTADDIINFFSLNPVNNLLLINPDNPSGNYIQKNDVLKLVKWANEKGILLIVDESFVDFSEEPDNSLIHEDIINENPNLIVVKSISKSYGVPGIRLGIMVSQNEELISFIKKDVAIWNINSFGEFYMQIAEKYSKDYLLSLERIKQSRTTFVDLLEQINGIRVIPSQANYLLLEITSKYSAKELTKLLLIKYNIIIKDLSSKIKINNKQFIRVAVRNDEDNLKLVTALNELMN